MNEINLMPSVDADIPEHNGAMYFEYQFSVNDPKISMTLSPEASLPDVLESFERFLRGAGYSFEGYLDFVEDENGKES